MGRIGYEGWGRDGGEDMKLSGMQTSSQPGLEFSFSAVQQAHEFRQNGSPIEEPP